MVNNDFLMFGFFKLCKGLVDNNMPMQLVGRLILEFLWSDLVPEVVSFDYLFVPFLWSPLVSSCYVVVLCTTGNLECDVTPHSLYG